MALAGKEFSILARIALLANLASYGKNVVVYLSSNCLTSPYKVFCTYEPCHVISNNETF